MALESLRDPLGRLSALPVTMNAAYDANSLTPNDMRWSATRQYVQNDVVAVDGLAGVAHCFILTGATSLLGGESPESLAAWQWVPLSGTKPYPEPPAPSTFTVMARMPSVSVSAWNNAAKVGRR